MNRSIHHEFVALDEGLGTVLHVDERDQRRNWLLPLGHEQPRDMQLVGCGRVLIGHHHGYTEFDLATGARVKELASLKGVTSVRRLPNGHTRLAGVNLLDATGVVLAELDAQDRVIEKQVLEGDYVRLMRETAAGTFLMMCNTRIRETDRAGKTLRELPVEGFLHAWKALRRPDGTIISSAGYGAFMVELDPNGRELRRFGGKGQVPEAVHPFFYAMFQLLPNGDVVVVNWQDHGPGHGAAGVQLLQFNPAGEIVWQWNEPALISSLQGVIVLDGLDVSKLHDERDGVMAPLC
ncbi:hypothetical protein [Opitutus sp. ER46]|uniref:hypothetical protein n=1 Tax=Opitutus sp. ER46 TaxID=2161864 RepID=UPI0011B26F88|nr:hypothetical protein [Opitutus sp. ER46]